MGGVRPDERIAIDALGDSPTYRSCVELFRFVSVLQLCRINRGHSAAVESLPTGQKLVIWSLAGAVMPVETDAEIVRDSLELDQDPASE